VDEFEQNFFKDECLVAWSQITKLSNETPDDKHATNQLGWTLCGRPNSSILRVPGDNLSMMP